MAVGDQRFLTRSLTVLITLGFTLFVAVSLTVKLLEQLSRHRYGCFRRGHTRRASLVRNAATGVTRTHDGFRRFLYGPQHNRGNL